MQATGRCPKCQSTELLRIKEHHGANTIAVGWTAHSDVTVTRYLCTSCGFSEEWIADHEDIAKLVKKYASAIPRAISLP